MEYMDGVTSLLDSRGHTGQERVVTIAIERLRMPDAAHSEGIIHRDIKTR